MYVIPDSPSMVLRSTHIMQIRIESARTGEWTPAPEGQKQRLVMLEVTLEEVLKGRTRQTPGERMTLTASQFQPNKIGMVSIPGIWSEKPLDHGTHLIIFATSTSDDALLLLVEPQCRGILPASEAAAGVRLAIRAETEPLKISDLLSHAISASRALDHTFVEYLSTKFSDPALARPETFALLLRLMESPQLPSLTRAGLFQMLYDEMAMSSTFSDDDIDAFTISMFHLLGLKEADGLHDNIASVYLPSLLGLTSGVPPRTADHVFRKDPAGRQQAEKALAAYRGTTKIDQLRAWLR